MSKKPATAKARTVAKGHKHVKPAAAHGKAATGHAQKHHKAAKHHAAAKKHKGTVARGLAPAADQVASCAAEALAASLRLTGLSVAPVDVLELYWRTAGDADAGAPISETLDAAARVGLAERRPVFAERPLDDLPLPFGQLLRHVEGMDLSEVGHDLGVGQLHGLILGVDLPGAHTVLATPEGWWSWGELWCPWCEWPDAVIEEAWEVSWR